MSLEVNSTNFKAHCFANFFSKSLTFQTNILGSFTGRMRVYLLKYGNKKKFIKDFLFYFEMKKQY